jgi:hypothetical protein
LFTIKKILLSQRIVVCFRIVSTFAPCHTTENTIVKNVPEP